jgi:hypothetical protein
MAFVGEHVREGVRRQQDEAAYGRRSTELIEGAGAEGGQPLRFRASFAARLA